MPRRQEESATSELPLAAAGRRHVAQRASASSLSLGSKIDVSVLIPVLNEAAHIRSSARSMQEQRFDGEVEFLFVDGGSDDGTREILRELAARDPRMRLMSNPARRTPNALNIGLREARGEFVARMDAHAEYPPDYLARAIERLRRGDVEWVCGPQVPRGGDDWSRRVAIALASPLGAGGSQRWLGGTDEAQSAAEVEVSPSSGVFTGVWRRSSLEASGGWDEGWPVNQDCELMARIQEAGGRVVMLRELAARYAPRSSLGGLARQYAAYGYYRAKTGRRHPRTMRPAHLLPPGVIFTAAAAAIAPRPLRRPAQSGLAVYAAALAATSAAAWSSHRRLDAATLPVVLATMHMAWGLGFLWGCLRVGPPLSALATAGRSAVGAGRRDRRNAE